MRLIDLTLTLTPGERGVAAEAKYTAARDGWNAATWHLYSHAGTGAETSRVIRRVPSPTP